MNDTIPQLYLYICSLATVGTGRSAATWPVLVSLPPIGNYLCFGKASRLLKAGARVAAGAGTVCVSAPSSHLRLRAPQSVH